MKNLFLFPVFILTFVLGAQTNKVNLVSSTIDETVLNFKLQSHKFKTVTTPKGEQVVVLAEGLSSIMERGAPDLPKYATSIVIPDLASMEVEIVSSKYTEMKDVEIAPSKGNFTRNIDPKTVPYTYGKVYTKDAFYPNKLAGLSEPYILRDLRGQAIHIFPFQYNPVKKILRIYSEIEVKIKVKDYNGKNTFVRSRSFNKLVKEYKNIYQNHFINFNATLSRYTPLEEEGNMLIICYDDWLDEMQDFVDWKNTIGRPTEMVSVTTAGGTASSIKTYVENYYNNNGLTYLLLVGDAAQVPTNNGGNLGGDSDNAYGYITGNDHYQEIFVGRFSAENATHVTTQVERTLEYEKGDQLQADWLNKLISIASQEGPGDDGEYDYQHLRNIQTDLLGFTYVAPPYEFFEGSQGGEDAPGDPSAASVANRINLGTGIINYTGHGSETSWATSGFNISDVNNLTNDNKLPFVCSVGCVNGVFVNTTGFGESWLRAENNGEPTGAVAIFASTINQSWAPPMIAQDEMVDLLVGASVHGTKRTYGGISINGCFQMIEESNDIAMIDTWTIFGDPSLYVRTDNPSNMNVTHDNVVIVGQNNFNVNCDLDGALATISKDGVIIGSAEVIGGTAVIPLDNLTPGDELTLAVVGFNKVTYIATVTVISPNGPYVVFESTNDEIDYGQSLDLDMSLKNVGMDDATNVTATLSSSDPYVTIIDNTENFGSITAGDTKTINSSYTISVADDVPDQHIINFELEITGTDSSNTSHTWNSTFTIKANAPDISIDNLAVINDDNNDGILDPGEHGDLSFTITNTGHADANFNGDLIKVSDPDNYLTLGSTQIATVNIAAGSSTDFVFTNASADAATPLGSPVDIKITVNAGDNNQYTDDSTQTLIIGIIPIYNISTGGTLSVCAGTFYDSGLDTGDYSNDEDYTMTFLAPADGFVNINFTSFELEDGYDFLYVYYGTDTSGTQVSGSPFTGTDSPGLLSSADGLTFRFTSDYVVSSPGWSADVSCSIPTAAPDCAANPVPNNGASDIFPDAVSWDAVLNATSYDVYFGTDPNPLNNSPVNVTANSYTFPSQLTPHTTYYWTVTPKNNIGDATNCNTWSFTTGATQYIMTDGATVTTCDGVFYDTGGPNGNYFNNENLTMTFLPGNSGDMLEFYFTMFDVEIGASGTQYDWLKVFDGVDTNAPLIGKFSADDGAPIPTELQPVTATNSQGALTFQFYSDGYVAQAGWEAQISCVNSGSINQLDNVLGIYPNPTEGLFTIKSNNLNNAELYVFSLSGQEILKTNIESDSFVVDLSKNTKGVYFVKIISDNKTAVYRVILK